MTSLRVMLESVEEGGTVDVATFLSWSPEIVVEVVGLGVALLGTTGGTCLRTLVAVRTFCVGGRIWGVGLFRNGILIGTPTSGYQGVKLESEKV